MFQISVLLSDCSVVTVIDNVPEHEIDEAIKLITHRMGNVSYMIESM